MLSREKIHPVKRAVSEAEASIAGEITPPVSIGHSVNSRARGLFHGFCRALPRNSTLRGFPVIWLKTTLIPNLAHGRRRVMAIATAARERVNCAVDNSIKAVLARTGVTGEPLFGTPAC